MYMDKILTLDNNDSFSLLDAKDKPHFVMFLLSLKVNEILTKLFTTIYSITLPSTGLMSSVSTSILFFTLSLFLYITKPHFSPSPTLHSQVSFEHLQTALTRNKKYKTQKT